MIDGLKHDTALTLMRIPQAEMAKISQTKDQKRIAETAKEFEAVFVSEMMKPMFEGIETDGPFGGGQAEEIFRSIMLQEYGKVIASTGRVGIAPHIQDAMIKLQEQQNEGMVS